MEHLLLQLIREAKQANPESEAVKVFEYLTERMEVRIDSRLQDTECNSSNSVYENNENAHELIELREALEKGDLPKAFDMGLLSTTRLDAGVNSELTIKFSNYDEYIHENDVEFKEYLSFSELSDGQLERLKNECADTLMKPLTGDDVALLRGQKSQLSSMEVNIDEDEEVVELVFKGYKYQILAAGIYGEKCGLFTLSDNWKEDLDIQWQ